VSWIAALKQGTMLAPMTFAGSCNRDLFEMWLEECLLPQLQPGDAIILDNASFHRSQAIDEIVAAAGCELWYLPPYSPDLNEIEHWWFVLKNWMRQRWDQFETFRDCVDAAFKYCPNVDGRAYTSWFGGISDRGESRWETRGIRIKGVSHC
jgi:transposase